MTQRLLCFITFPLPLDHPLQVGGVFAEVLQGQCFPFPIYAESYIVVTDDGHGTAIELYPTGTQVIPDLEEVGFSSSAIPQPFLSVHAAISVAVSQAQVEQIAQREGWLVRLCNRDPFKVIEFWIENRFLVELLTPELVPQYLQFMNPAAFEAFVNQAPC